MFSRNSAQRLFCKASSSNGSGIIRECNALIQNAGLAERKQWLTLSPAGPPQESWTGVRTPAPRISGLTEEGRIGPKNVEVGAAEGRDGRPHPNAGLTLSQEREDGSCPEGAG
ncbi:hypothetical protein DdX_22192 [Ditylenchus destructor]|uniref:Uncharacterized protein n=1 Tax=Ditylenchus destructor TaxID=166010 RepID=A0AAD4MDX7_9BILA|nr:hypothetical protein DdX_22192 [Ditylenchus destructor]